MIKIELTENQLDDLKTVLDYVCKMEEQSYLEFVDQFGEEHDCVVDHIYPMANNLRSLTWSTV